MNPVHRLAKVIEDADQGRFPKPDGGWSRAPRWRSGLEAVVAFTAHAVFCLGDDITDDRLRGSRCERVRGRSRPPAHYRHRWAGVPDRLPRPSVRSSWPGRRWQRQARPTTRSAQPSESEDRGELQGRSRRVRFRRPRPVRRGDPRTRRRWAARVEYRGLEADRRGRGEGRGARGGSARPSPLWIPGSRMRQPGQRGKRTELLGCDLQAHRLHAPPAAPGRLIRSPTLQAPQEVQALATPSTASPREAQVPFKQTLPAGPLTLYELSHTSASYAVLTTELSTWFWETSRTPT